MLKMPQSKFQSFLTYFRSGYYYVLIKHRKENETHIYVQHIIGLHTNILNDYMSFFIRSVKY